MEEHERSDSPDLPSQNRVEAAAARPSTSYFDRDQTLGSHENEPVQRHDSSSSLHFSDVGDATNLHSEGVHSVDEREMRRQLNDIESSFLPEPAGGDDHPEETLGADDTYVNVGSSEQPLSLRSLMGIGVGASPREEQPDDRDEERYHQTDRSTEKEDQQYDGPSDQEEHSRASLQEHTDTPAIDTSSPAAAAAHRNLNRGAPSSAARSDTSRRDGYDTAPTRSSSNRSFDSRLSSANLSRASSARSNPRLSRSPRPQDVSLPPSDVPSLISANGSLRMRPNLLHARQASHASTQSGRSDMSGSDITINADYALQTGGAAPGDSPLVTRPTRDLSRFPSLGSVASVLERDEDSGMPAFNRSVSGMSALGSFRMERSLDPLHEEGTPNTSSPNTPRAQYSQMPGITDTAITRHVQNIQVPNTVAKEYRQKHRSFSPEKRPASSNASFQSRPQSTLTLKEQNGKIDKLTKENFDLKLKIHFLDQALQNRSDEGVKDMINKNVQFQTDLANERKENQSLRRKVRELEKRVRELEEELAEGHERTAETHLASHETMEIEINELREQLDHCQVRITKLSAENLAKEMEKRKMADYVTALRDRPTPENPAAEEAEMWKDLLETESARREQAEEDLRKLREEMILLRSEKSSRRRSVLRPERRDRDYEASASGRSEFTDDRNGAVSGSSGTLVEHLRQENIELRRDLGAQTSMLTSRNKERERLQHEIEDLKLMSRKGDGSRSITGDSILERSASRAHQRTDSQVGGRTSISQFSDAERDEYERREGTLRDQNARMKLDYQDLEKEAQARMDYINQLEEDVQSIDNDLAAAVEDLKSLQKERDDALRALEYRDAEYEKLVDEYKRLEEEAIQNIEGLEENVQRTERSRKQLAADLKHRNEDFSALQQELRNLGTRMLEFEDDREASLRRIETLEQELEEATQELDTLDKKLRETTQKSNRLEIQSESLQSEISFLREEQEGDKIKIGDLENALNAAQQAVQDEKEKMDELEASLVEERRQHEVLEDQSKQEVQKVLNDLNADNSRSKDEVRRLKRSLTSQETETTTYKTRLEELENNLRHSLGDLNGTRASLLHDIEKLQDDLEKTLHDLDDARADVADKDRLIKNRDISLENTGLENRRLSDLLDKERQGRKQDLHDFERSKRGNSTHLRSVANHETKVQELETARNQDKRRAALLEQQYREQLSDRNNLLLALWARLSTLCGNEWSQTHSLVNGEITSTESIAKSLPHFNRNIIDATKQIESLIGGFKSRIRNVEKGLSKDFQTLEHNLDARIKRMDFLERAVKDAQAAIDAQKAAEEAATQLRHTNSNSSSIDSRRLNKVNTEELAKLRSENKTLKAELKFQRQNPTLAAQEKLAQDAAVTANRRSSAISMTAGASTSKMASLSPSAIASKLLRHHSTSAVDTLNQASSEAVEGRKTPSIVIATPPIQPSEQRWMHRLREMERRLKAEREARLLDRRGARQRLEERSAENEELKAMLERERERRGSLGGSSEGGAEFGQGEDMGVRDGRTEASID